MSDSESFNEKILSGMLLHHSLIYGEFDIYEELKNPSITGIQRSASALTEIGRVYDCAIIIYRFLINGEIKHRIIPLGGARQFFQSPLANLPKSRDDGVLWIHLATEVALLEIMEAYRLPMSLYRSFKDSSPYAKAQKLVIRVQAQNGNKSTLIDEESVDALLIDLLSANMKDGIINMKKLHVFILFNMIITFEQSTHAVMDSEVEDINIPQSQSNKSSFTSLHAEISSITITNRRIGSFRTLSTGSELNLKEEEDDSSKPLLPPHAAAAAAADNDIASSSTSNKEQITGALLNAIVKQLQSVEKRNEVLRVGSTYILYEATLAMLHISTPVILVHSCEMLRLHDAVFLRKRKPDYDEGVFLMEQVGIFKSSYDMLRLLFNETLEVISKPSSEINMAFPLSFEHRSDLAIGYSKALKRIDRLLEELNRINSSLHDLISRRNDRVNLVLSVAATTFLPLTFLTGVFGMNLEKANGFGYIFESEAGVYLFFGLAAVSVALILFWFYKQGCFETLVSSEMNSNVSALKKQYYGF